MYLKIFISISLCFTLLACSNPPKNAAQKEESKSSPSPSGKRSEGSNADQSSSHEMAKKTSKLTNANVRKFMTRYGRENKASRFRITTSMGDIVIRLFEDTPLHRANFLYLTKEGYWDNTWFYRVSKGHVIQAGNTDEQATVDKRNAIGDYTLPAEIGEHYHFTGAVAMVRSYHNNPQKRSDPYEFYITLGKKYSAAELQAMEQQQDIETNAQQRKIYTTRGGAPHLDNDHTVFGEVIEGMEVVRAISKVKVDSGEWPLDNIPIQVKAISLKNGE